MKEHLLEYERMKLRGIITDEEIHRSYEECRTFIDIYGVILDLITIFQLFLSGITSLFLRQHQNLPPFADILLN